MLTRELALITTLEFAEIIKLMMLSTKHNTVKNCHANLCTHMFLVYINFFLYLSIFLNRFEFKATVDQGRHTVMDRIVDKNMLQTTQSSCR